jgi:hypothetical protein
MKKPVPEDFGITAEEYECIKAGRSSWRRAIEVAVWGGSIIVGMIAFLFDSSEKLNMRIASFLVVGFFALLILGVAGAVLLAIVKCCHPLYRKARLYRQALHDYYQTLKEYWVSLKGVVFEHELGKLYTKLGYKVEYTSASGDKGIDLFLRKDNKSTLVQCKGHKNPVGPSTVRELYGTLMAHQYLADSAILACPAGFTRGARECAIGKCIQLVSAIDLVEMAESIGQQND